MSRVSIFDQGCQKIVLWFSKGSLNVQCSFKVLLKFFQKSFKVLSKFFQISFKDHSNCFQSFFKVSLKFFKVSNFIQSSLKIHSMLSKFFQNSLKFLSKLFQSFLNVDSKSLKLFAKLSLSPTRESLSRQAREQKFGTDTH